jgi:hypothetical protein
VEVPVRKRSLAALLALAFDPTRILRAQGLIPDSWQAQFLLSSHRQVLLNCSRQSGKSTTVAALALHTAVFTPASLTLLLSPSLRQSAELFRKVLDGYDALRRPLRARTRSRTQLELANGSRIIGLPGEEETVRSFSGVKLLIIDEAARVADDLYRSVRPMLAVSNGRLICLSTPFGQRGFFFHEWEEAGDAWHRIRIPWYECPRITPEVIAEETRSLGESWVRQEYETSFEALQGLVYPDFEAQCACDDWPNPVGEKVGGIDFGWNNPFAALWGVRDRDDVLWIGGERYARETPIHEHAAALPKDVLWYGDPSGATEIAELRRANLKVGRGVNDLTPGIAAVTARLRTGRLTVYRPACPSLFAEAKLYRYPGPRDQGGQSENPIDKDNHALGALRYLISQLDAGFLARFRKPSAASSAASSSRSRLDNDQLWTTI